MLILLFLILEAQDLQGGIYNYAMQKLHKLEEFNLTCTECALLNHRDLVRQKALLTTVRIRL